MTIKTTSPRVNLMVERLDRLAAIRRRRAEIKRLEAENEADRDAIDRLETETEIEALAALEAQEEVRP